MGTKGVSSTSFLPGRQNGVSASLDLTALLWSLRPAHVPRDKRQRRKLSGGVAFREGSGSLWTEWALLMTRRQR